MASQQTIEAIVAAIAALSGSDRRQLARRLRVSGLLAAEEVVVDRDRLTVAPAVTKATQQAAVAATESTTASTAKPTNQPPPAPAPKRGEPREAGARMPLHMAGQAIGTGARTPAGKVVLGAPTPVATTTEPHAMAPLPGQAPEQPIGIVFDGGSKGNPGLGYGSYALRWPGHQQQIVQLTYGQGVTNNEAEYDTLIAALEAVLNKLHDARADVSTARLDIRGDSLLVINQVLGEWKCTEARMRTRRDRVRALLRDFGAWQLTHHDRANSVRVLGH